LINFLSFWDILSDILFAYSRFIVYLTLFVNLKRRMLRIGAVILEVLNASIEFLDKRVDILWQSDKVNLKYVQGLFRASPDVIRFKYLIQEAKDLIEEHEKD
jgi:hypothetical protein